MPLNATQRRVLLALADWNTIRYRTVDELVKKSGLTRTAVVRSLNTLTHRRLVAYFDRDEQATCTAEGENLAAELRSAIQDIEKRRAR